MTPSMKEGSCLSGSLGCVRKVASWLFLSGLFLARPKSDCFIFLKSITCWLWRELGIWLEFNIEFGLLVPAFESKGLLDFRLNRVFFSCGFFIFGSGEKDAYD